MSSGCQRSTLVLALSTLLEEEKAEAALHLLQPYWPEPVVLATSASTPAIPATPATPTTPTTPATLVTPVTPGSAGDSFSQGLSLSLASEARAPPSHPQWPGEKVSVLNLSWTPTTKLKTQTYSAQQLSSLDLVYKGEGQSVLTWWTRVREQASLNKWGSSDTLNHIMVFFLSKSIKLALELFQQTKAVPAEGEEFIPHHHQITKITDLLLYLRERHEKEEDLRRPYHLFFARKQKGGERLRDYFHGLQVLQNEVQRNDIAQQISAEQLRMQLLENCLPSIKSEFSMRQAGQRDLTIDQMLDIGDVMYRAWKKRQDSTSRPNNKPTRRTAMNQLSAQKDTKPNKKLSEAELATFCKRMKQKYGVAHGKFIDGDERVILQKNRLCFICFKASCTTRECPHRQQHLQAIQQQKKRTSAMNAQEAKKKAKLARSFRNELEREHSDEEDDMNEIHTVTDMLNTCESDSEMETHFMAAAAQPQVDMHMMNDQDILANATGGEDDQDYTTQHPVEPQATCGGDGPVFQ